MPLPGRGIALNSRNPRPLGRGGCQSPEDIANFLNRFSQSGFYRLNAKGHLQQWGNSKKNQRIVMIQNIIEVIAQPNGHAPLALTAYLATKLYPPLRWQSPTKDLRTYVQSLRSRPFRITLTGSIIDNRRSKLSFLPANCLSEYEARIQALKDAARRQRMLTNQPGPVTQQITKLLLFNFKVTSSLLQQTCTPLLKTVDFLIDWATPPPLPIQPATAKLRMSKEPKTRPEQFEQPTQEQPQEELVIQPTTAKLRMSKKSNFPLSPKLRKQRFWAKPPEEQQTWSPPPPKPQEEQTSSPPPPKSGKQQTRTKPPEEQQTWFTPPPKPQEEQISNPLPPKSHKQQTRTKPPRKRQTWTAPRIPSPWVSPYQTKAYLPPKFPLDPYVWRTSLLIVWAMHATHDKQTNTPVYLNNVLAFLKNKDNNLPLSLPIDFSLQIFIRSRYSVFNLEAANNTNPRLIITVKNRFRHSLSPWQNLGCVIWTASNTDGYAPLSRIKTLLEPLYDEFDALLPPEIGNLQTYFHKYPEVFDLKPPDLVRLKNEAPDPNIIPPNQIQNFLPDPS